MLSGCAAWRIGQSRALARASEPLQQQPATPALRLLIVGDSTGVGTGASAPQASLAGLIGAGHPRLAIDNRSRDGARLAALPAQLDGAAARYDIVLVQAGGNDVIAGTEAGELRATLDAVVRAAQQRVPDPARVLLMPAGNVGNAPFFFAPVSWLMTRRARVLHQEVRAAAQRHGATYVNLFKERDDDPFAQRRELNAADGLHPSDDGYRVWWDNLRSQSGIERWLLPAA